MICMRIWDFSFSKIVVVEKLLFNTINQFPHFCSTGVPIWDQISVNKNLAWIHANFQNYPFCQLKDSGIIGLTIGVSALILFFFI